MKRKLMLTVDVEAQSARAERDHVDRLIWGRFPGAAESGIGTMMDIAERHGAKMTMFVDYCEAGIYGDGVDAVARAIAGRGHDAQLHAHADFMPAQSWRDAGLGSQFNLSLLDANQARLVADYICDCHERAVGVPAKAFRGGGYRYNQHLLDALKRRGVNLDTSVNVSRSSQPVVLDPQKQFEWTNGVLEVPVSNVRGFRDHKRLFDFNFNAGAFVNAEAMAEYLDVFHAERGEDAIAVLVMHSWSFLVLTDRRWFTHPAPHLVERFEAFLKHIAPTTQIVTAAEVADLWRAGSLAVDPKRDFNAQPALAPVVRGEFSACSICFAPKEAFTAMNGRRCPGCGSLERQRGFALAYEQAGRDLVDVAGQSALVFSPSVSELKFLRDRGLGQAVTADIRPEAGAQQCLDMCAMPSIPDRSQRMLFASYLMPVVHDMEAALDEVARVLAPDGIFISVEPMAAGERTLEARDLERISSWYGSEALEKYRVGSFRSLGLGDYQAALEKRFETRLFAVTDPITGTLTHTFFCKLQSKQSDDGVAMTSEPLSTAAEIARGLLRKIAADSAQGTFAWLPVTPAGFTEERDVPPLPAVIENWRALSMPESVRKVRTLAGVPIVDVILAQTVLDFLPAGDVVPFLEAVAARLKPHGAAMITLKEQRLTRGEASPSTAYIADNTSFGLPEGSQLHSLSVGDGWLKQAFARAGLAVDVSKANDGQHVFIVRPFLASQAGTDGAAGELGRQCNLCGEPIVFSSGEQAVCPSCKSRPRTRTLPFACDAAIAPQSGRPSRLLGFAVTSTEEKVLGRYFDTLVSASLYGNYRKGHLEGVDVRNLHSFSDAEFDGICGILLFDYFTEHDAALAEAARVLKPGGALFTHIASYRLTDGNETPVNTATIKPRDGYFAYVPSNADMPSVKVGRQWFVKAIERAGLVAKHFVLDDPVTGEAADWFIGIKPEDRSIAAGDKKAADLSQSEPSSRPKVGQLHANLRASVPQSPLDPQTQPLAHLVEETPDRLVYEAKFPERPDLGTLRLSLASIRPLDSVASFDFAEHVYDAERGTMTDTVILCGRGAVGVSEDLGRSWRRVEVPGAADIRMWNAFTTRSGRHIIQAVGWQGPQDGVPDPARHGVLFLFDRDWKFLGRSFASIASWLGTASIGDSDGAIIFGDYHNNSERYKPDFDQSRAAYMQTLKPTGLWRSTNDGDSWEKVFERSPLDIRHMHTVQPDPYQSGKWWASSGDMARECHVWSSQDHGISWADVTNPRPDVVLPLPPEKRSAVFRYTDIVITPDSLLWGADDLLGAVADFTPRKPLQERSGSRIYLSQKSNPLQPKEIGYVGQLIRKFIDVGPGWLVLTEGKTSAVGLNPKVFFLSKQLDTLCYLFEVRHYGGVGVGSAFTYGRTGRALTEDGAFYSFKLSRDVFDDGQKALRWEINFA